MDHRPTSKRSETNSTLILLATLADTTWRIVVPTIALALIGLKLDLVWHTAPWLTLLGTATGFVIAAFLVRRQLKELP
jgi:F0F1-type ATP synthase assembly protein I